MNDKEFNSVVLAAFLHDIGKFMQRAEVDITGIGGMKDDLVYEHSSYTYHFFDKPLISNWPDCFDLNLCRDLSGFHHNPKEPLHYIIQQADWLSAGMDRPEENQGVGDKYKYLYSIFENISKDAKSERFKSYGLNILNPESDNSYPIEASNKAHSKNTYKNLWDQFISDVRKIEPNMPFRHFLSFMDSLLEQYTWCIPANTKEKFPDISLYDHMKTTAAFAACLYAYHSDNKSFDNQHAIINTEKQKFLYVVADLSGIQNYIFNLSKEQSKGVSKVLRARSFYLSAITRGIIFSLLNRLGLPTVCNLQDCGGKLMLLAPNTEPVKENLKNAQLDIEHWFLENFCGDLTLNIAVSDALSKSDFEIANFKDNVLKKINMKLDLEKKQKLSCTLINSSQWDEDKFVRTDMKFPDREGEKICAISGKYPAMNEKIDFGSEKELYISEQCKTEWEIGKYLPNADYLIYGDVPFGGKSFSILENTSLKIKLSLVEKKVPCLYDDKILRIEKLSYTQNNRYISVYPTAKEVPRGLDGEILSFEQIAAKSVDEETGLGARMIGVLKADVDNLGKIFSKEIKIKKNFSLSRFVTLSRMINFFFTAKIPAKIEKDYKGNIYTIFAGGDDLTLIGSWESILSFAKDSYESFKDFTCRNDKITLSAGVAIVHEKYPIRRAIEIAEEYLKKSKSTDKDNLKNKITCFKTTVFWDKYKDLLAQTDDLNNYLKKSADDESSKGLTMGLLYRLLRYHDMALKSKNQSAGCSPDMRELLWHSHLYYDIGRNINKDDNKLKGFITDLFNSDNVDFLKIPLFTVLYKNRKPQEKETDNE